MSEKVLGFKEKDASKAEYMRFKWDKDFTKKKGCHYVVNSNKLVPVNLKSESVMVKWLEQRLNELEKEIVNDFEAFRITDYTHARFKALRKCLLAKSESNEAKK